MSDNEILKIDAIVTNEKIFVAEKNKSSNYRKLRLDKYLFDGILADDTFHDIWKSISKIPKIVEKVMPDITTRKVYLLKDTKFKSEDIPLEIPYDDAYDSNYNAIGIYEEYGQLYELIHDKEPQSPKTVEFEINIIREVDTITDKKGYFYPSSGEWSHKEYNWNSNKVLFELENEIMLPEIMLHDTKATISSDNLYAITRRYIKDNIDRDVAHITSDYNFCFTVQKIIKLSQEEKYTVSPLLQSGKKSKKKVKNYRMHRKLSIFRMTNSYRKYQDYPVIQPISGKNLADLQKNIDTFLQKVINIINEPIVDCKHCNGAGVETIKVFTHKEII